MDTLLQNTLQGHRLTPEEGLWILQNLSWFEVCEAGWELRKIKHGSRFASYTVFRLVNYTNICNVDCKFCSFQRTPDQRSAYVLNTNEVLAKMQDGVENNADQLFLQGGVNPDLPLDYYLDLLTSLKSRFPHVHIRGFSAIELLSLSEVCQKPFEEVVSLLKKAGLDSIPGAGAELLVERMRQKMSPHKTTTQEWVHAVERCHEVGLKGSATMVVGAGETDAEVIEHLEVIRGIQDKTAGFWSFIPWVYQQQTKRFKATPPRTDEFLKLLALCRLYLDNVPHLETSVMVLGKDVGKLALRVGADDVSSVVLEENVLKSYGLKTEKEAMQYLQSAGFQPVRRNFDYEYYQNQDSKQRLKAQ